MNVAGVSRGDTIAMTVAVVSVQNLIGIQTVQEKNHQKKKELGYSGSVQYQN